MTAPERPRRRPPWWPAEEPWPPQRGMGWRQGGPPPFIRRIFLALTLAMLGLVVVIVGGATLLFWLAATRFGWLHANAPIGRAPFIPVVALVFLGVLLSVTWRLVRRATSPVSELMQGVERVADG